MPFTVQIYTLFVKQIKFIKKIKILVLFHNFKKLIKMNLDKKMLTTVVLAIVVGSIVSEIVSNKFGDKLGLNSFEEE